jgi:uncharacterized membrane protein
MVDNSDFQDDFAGDDLDLAEDPDLDDKIPDFDEEGFEEGSQLLRPDEIGSSEAVAAAIKEGGKNIQQQEEESRPAKDYVIAAVAYSLCAATLLVINKASVDSIPSPAIVVASQLLFSAVAVKVLVYYGKVEAESLEIEKTKKFIGVSLLFTLCLVTNVKALKSTSVQTVIVMRACSPIFVALFDWLYLKTGFPHSTTWACLAGIAVGALIYCIFDDGFNMSSVLWPLIYFVSICSEMVFVNIS